MLRTVQRAFQDAVLGAGDGALEDHVAAPGLAARIAVYRNTVQSSLVEVLAAAFPVTQRIVGQAFFSALARHFAVNRPPRLPQLSAYGADFPAFLAEDAGRHGLPYLADTARLEWARGDSYFAADGPPLAPGVLAETPPEALDGLKLRLHPATRLVRSPFPIHRIWTVNQPEVDDVPAVDMTVAENVLLTRRDGRVALRTVSTGAAVFVAAIAKDAGLGEAATQALTEDAAFDLEAALRDHLIAGTFLA